MAGSIHHEPAIVRSGVEAMAKYFEDRDAARRAGLIGGAVKKSWSPLKRAALVARLNRARRQARARRLAESIAAAAREMEKS